MTRRVRRKPSKGARLKTEMGEMQLEGDHLLALEARQAAKDGEASLEDLDAPKSEGARRRSKAWSPPSDMPKWQALLVRAGRMCGARQNRLINAAGDVEDRAMTELDEEERKEATQLYCRARPPAELYHSDVLPPHRCFFHGGVSAFTGSKERRAKVRAAAYYAGVLTADDALALMDAARQDHGDLDAEIALAKSRLRRMVADESKAMRLVDEGREDEALRIYGIKVKSGVGREGDFESTESDRRMPDWVNMIHRQQNLVLRLVKGRHELMGTDAELDARGVAERIRAFVTIAREKHSVEEDLEAD